jgi:hypothetical protein
MVFVRRGSVGLPGGRAYYRGKDAYAAQSRENESRIVQPPGYVKALIQHGTVYPTGVNTIIWLTGTGSVFIPTMEAIGWFYNATTGVFTCQRDGRYQIACGISVTNSSSSDYFVLQVRTVRNISNVPYTFVVNTDTSATAGASTDMVLAADFNFNQGDLVSVEFNNQGSGSRTVGGLAGVGTTTEVQNLGYFNLWQIDD